jgi:TolB-like protein/tetratricopeptide (TPR) repeat protein
MELAVGRSLEAELRERGPWSAAEAAQAGIELCKALSAVHAAGFVHGDVKAQNVVREDSGRLVLMDFGARQVRHAGPGERLSGTPLYLAPEVLTTGHPSVESDLYSLGVLLYHLVTGGYPVSASSIEALREQHEQRAATSPAALLEGLDSGLQQVLTRVLSPNPAHRFHSALEMKTALARLVPADAEKNRWAVGSWLLLAALTVAVVTLATLTYRSWVAPPAELPSIAVLPFRTVAQNVGEHISEGISADLTSLLSRLPDLRVVSGVSVQQFRNTTKTAQEIGRAVGARTLLAGFVQLSGDIVNVNVELVDTASGRQVWGQTFQRRTRDLFTAQSEIASSIAGAVRGRLSTQDARLLVRPPMNFEAFELYSLGRYHWAKRTREGLERSIEYFTRAAQVDPSSALPYAGLSDAYVLSSVYGLFAPRDAQLKAEAAAQRALVLDPNLAEAHAALGSILQEQLRWEEARTELVRAIDLQPGYAPARHWYALLLTGRGEFDEAIRQMRQAVDQDPLSVALRGALGFIYYMQGDFPTALREYRYAAELESDRSWLHRHMALAYLANGDSPGALRELDLAVTESQTDLNAIRATVYALVGRTAEAGALVVPLTFSTSDGPFSAIDQAAAQTALENKPLAFAWLERAVDNREHDVQYVAVDPRFAALRGEARFVDVLKRIGVEVKSGGVAR